MSSWLMAPRPDESSRERTCIKTVTGTAHFTFGSPAHLRLECHFSPFSADRHGRTPGQVATMQRSAAISDTVNHLPRRCEKSRRRSASRPLVSRCGRLGVRVCANEAESGIVDRELQDVYVLLDDRPLEAYRPDPVELASLARFALKDLLPLLAGEASTASGVSLAAVDHTIEPVNVTLDDFIPTIDRYFFRVAIAVGHVLRGEQYVAV